MKDLRISELNDIYGGLLSERQSAILREYFDFDLSYGEIAEAFGITRQAVGQVIEVSSKQLDLFESKLGILEAIRKLKRLYDKTSDMATRAELATIVEGFKKYRLGEC